MRVKKFEAKNMKEALKMVKNELGPDAVILSARDNRKSFGLAGEASVEITAAVSDSTLQKKRFVESRLTQGDRERFKMSDARTQRTIINKMVDNRTRETLPPAPRRPITTTSYIDIPDEIENSPRRRAALEQASGKNIRELLNGFEQDFDLRRVASTPAQRRAQPQPTPQNQPPTSNQAQPSAESPLTAGADRARARIRQAAREAWSVGANALGVFEEPKAKGPPVQPQQSSGAGLEMHKASDPAEINILKGEIDRLNKVLEGFRKVPQSFVSMHPGADYGIPFELSFMFQKLSDAGVSIDNTVEILQAAMKELDQVQMKKPPVVDAWVARWFLNQVHVVSKPWQNRIHFFVGPAGSGKTSTLIKLASQLVVKDKRKVAVLSTDAYKVGAVDQLKIYCQILNVPFAVIRSRSDWDWVLGQLANVDHILVDSPGFQLRELDEIQTIKSLLPPPECQAMTHLCLSATSKDGDALESARRYKVSDYQDLIFTNLDQSVQHGIIYNLHRKTGRPLHSFGLGNRIPEDFEAASKERVLDLIFKLTKFRREHK